MQLDAEVVGEGLRVADGALGGVARGLGDADDVLGAERVDGDGGDEAGVDAAGEGDQRLLEAVLVHVVARAEDERVVDLGLVGERGRDRGSTGALPERREVELIESGGPRGRRFVELLLARRGSCRCAPEVCQRRSTTSRSSSNIVGAGERARRSGRRRSSCRRRRARPGRRPGSRSRRRRRCRGRGRRACARGSGACRRGRASR